MCVCVFRYGEHRQGCAISHIYLTRERSVPRQHGNGHFESRKGGHYRRGVPGAAVRRPGGRLDERMVCGATVSRRTDGRTDTGKPL